MERLRYFLGSNSPQGFYGFFPQVYDDNWKVWLIKGGPGSGKSTLMRTVVKGFEAVTGTPPEEWEYIHCSSDPASLDAIIHEGRRLFIADATAPHTLEAHYPGAVEQLVDMGGGFRVAELRAHRAEIVSLSVQNAKQHRLAQDALSHAATICAREMLEAVRCLKRESLESFATSWLEKLWPIKEGGKGQERVRELSAVTPDGVLFYEDTIRAVADTIYVLQDVRGAAAPLLLACLRNGLVERGYDVIGCRCSLFPAQRLEQLIVPQCRMAFVTQGPGRLFCAAQGIELSLEDFYLPNSPLPAEIAKKQLSEAVDDAVRAMRQARTVHDELEAIYTGAMDFSFADALAEKLVRQLAAQ